MIEFDFLTFSSFPLRQPEYEFWFSQESNYLTTSALSNTIVDVLYVVAYYC